MLALALLVGVALLLLSRGEPEELTDAEVEALVRAAPPAQSAPPLPTRWATPTHPAALHLTTEPAGAMVTLDGEPVGRTPLHLDGLRPTFYTVTLRLPDHAPLDTSLYLASSSVLALDVALPALLQTDAVRADAVRADAMPVEPVPTARREPARHDALPRAGVHADRRGTPSGGGAAPARPAPRPEAPTPKAPPFASASPEVLRRVSHTGSLYLTSTPAGAEVHLNGVARGRTPLSLSGLRPGPYVVTLSLPGRPLLSYHPEVTAQAVSVVTATFAAE